MATNTAANTPTETTGRALYSNVVDFTVGHLTVIAELGRNSKTFLIPRSIACTSRLLNRYRSPDRYQPFAKYQVILQIDPRLFNIWHNWAHSNKIHKKGYTEKSAQGNHEDAEHLLLAKLHILGAELADDTFRDFIIDLIKAKAEDVHPFKRDSTVIKYTYANAIRSPRLLEFMIEIWRRYATAEELKAMIKDETADPIFRSSLELWDLNFETASRQKPFKPNELVLYKSARAYAQQNTSTGSKRKSPSS